MSCLICAGHAESVECTLGWEERRCSQCGCYRMSQSLILLMMEEGQIFDTELAARVAGLPRVGLAAVLEELLGVTLAKEHSAADWSVRPLPEAMLTYAALDVELLVPLREALIARLEADGKLAWAEQEFEHVRTAPPPAPKKDPWRGTSGSQTLRRPVQRAVLKRGPPTGA